MFEACQKEAPSHGAQVTGSELIGLVPQEAILNAGKFYTPNVTDEAALINEAAEHLLLDKIRPFTANERIFEKAYQKQYLND